MAFSTSLLRSTSKSSRRRRVSQRMLGSGRRSDGHAMELSNAATMSSVSLRKSSTKVLVLRECVLLRRERVCTAESRVRIRSTYIVCGNGWSRSALTASEAIGARFRLRDIGPRPCDMVARWSA